MDIAKHCKGCLIYNEYTEMYSAKCNFEYRKHNQKCPCITCLLKMVCLESCDKHLKYHGTERTTTFSSYNFNKIAKYMKYIIDDLDEMVSKGLFSNIENDN